MNVHKSTQAVQFSNNAIQNILLITRHQASPCLRVTTKPYMQFHPWLPRAIPVV